MFLVGFPIINDSEKDNIRRCRILGCICRDVARRIPASAQNKFRPPHTRWLKIIFRKIIITKAYLYYNYMVKDKRVDQYMQIPPCTACHLYLVTIITNIRCTRSSSQRLKIDTSKRGEYSLVNVLLVIYDVS